MLDYATLPQKRMGAGCLIRNQQGHILLVKPTYKPVWEIPGGIVEQDESPRACCQREVAEELGLVRTIGRLLIVDYTAATGAKTESLMFIFDGGTITAVEIGDIQLPAAELSTFAFFAPAALPADLTPSLRQRILAACQQQQPGDVYLENRYCQPSGRFVPDATSRLKPPRGSLLQRGLVDTKIDRLSSPNPHKTISSPQFETFYGRFSFNN